MSGSTLASSSPQASRSASAFPPPSPASVAQLSSNFPYIPIPTPSTFPPIHITSHCPSLSSSMPPSIPLLPDQPPSYTYLPQQVSQLLAFSPQPFPPWFSTTSVSSRNQILSVENSARPSASSSSSSSSIGLPVSPGQRRYIHRPNRQFISPAINSIPFPVSFPIPATHISEQGPTFSLFIFCRWKRFESKSQGAKVRSVNYGCRECNIALCRECFPVFHSTAC